MTCNDEVNDGLRNRTQFLKVRTEITLPELTIKNKIHDNFLLSTQQELLQ